VTAESSSTSMKRRLELEVAHTVAQVLGGSPKSRDTPGPGALDGMDDFDVTLLDGRIVALEATTAARQETIRTIVAMQKLHVAPAA
jgi:hypothetical protein